VITIGLPKDFPPFTTVQYYFYRLCDSGLLDIINEMLVAASRLLCGRKPCRSGFYFFDSLLELGLF